MVRVTAERLDALLEAAKGVCALVVGDLMLDRYVSGRVERVSPEAPVPVVGVEREWSGIGGASNVAANIAALGARCHVVGCTGIDGAGDALIAELERLGVSTDGVLRTATRPTTVKTRVLARHQQIVRFDHENAADVEGPLAEEVTEAAQRLASEADVLVMEDYDKGVLVERVIQGMLAAARAKGVPTVVDPKRRRFFGYAGATVFKPNAKELEDALGEVIRPEDPEWMERTRAHLACEHLLLTLGERGVALASRGAGLVRIPTAARAVFDVSGAGDTVTAVVAVILAAGGSIVEAAVVANHAAAVEVQKAGVATVTPSEIRAHLRAHPDSFQETS